MAREGSGSSLCRARPRALRDEGRGGLHRPRHRGGEAPQRRGPQEPAPQEAVRPGDGPLLLQAAARARDGREDGLAGHRPHLRADLQQALEAGERGPHRPRDLGQEYEW